MQWQVGRSLDPGKDIVGSPFTTTVMPGPTSAVEALACSGPGNVEDVIPTVLDGFNIGDKDSPSHCLIWSSYVDWLVFYVECSCRFLCIYDAYVVHILSDFFDCASDHVWMVVRGHRQIDVEFFCRTIAKKQLGGGPKTATNQRSRTSLPGSTSEPVEDR